MTDSPLHILLVDDEAPFREVIAERLVEHGYRVDQASTGEAALERLKEFAFDILVTDLRLPGVDGRQVLDEALTRYPDIIAVVVTGFGTVREAVEGSVPRVLSPSRFSSTSCSMNLRRRSIGAGCARRTRIFGRSFGIGTGWTA